VVVTNGGMHALYITFRALLEPGDEVVMPDPMWTEIAENIRLAGGTPVRVTLEESKGMAYTAEAIAKKITSKTRAIFLNTPHNPTGMVMPERELRAIADLAIEKKLWIISDEAYEHVIFDGEKHVSIGSLKGVEDRTISLFSMSKSYAMSGLRMGYLAVRDPLILERVKKLLRCTINGVNSITQYGAAAALSGPQDAPKSMGEEYQARRDILMKGLEGIKALKPFKPHGSFFLWAAIHPEWEGYQGKKDDWAMANYLIDQGGVGCSPGTAFGPAGAGHVRLAFSCDHAQVEAATAVIRKLLK
jgi:aspartate/methionine/tyrosine aminotransferase